MSRRLGAVVLAVALGVLAGCGGGPSASEVTAGRRWLEGPAGRAWTTRADSLQVQARRVLGRAGTGTLDPTAGDPEDAAVTTAPVTPGSTEPGADLPLVEWCRTAQDPGSRPPAFPVASVQDELAAISLTPAVRACAEGDLSAARQLAHQQVDRLSRVDRLLAPYR